MNVFFLSILVLTYLHHSSAFLGLNHLKNFFIKEQCPIQLYDPKDSSFIGHKIYANIETFHPLLRTLSQYAQECRVKLNVIQSFIQETSTMSMITLRNHTAMLFRLGEAIEFDLYDEDKKLLCNKICMKKSLSRLSELSEAQCFLRKVRHDSKIRQDSHHPTILIRRRSSPNNDERKGIQNKCKKLHLDQ